MKVSVIIPAYNEEKYLERTLKAIKDTEVIVVCNGCTDRTEDIAQKYATKVLVLTEKGVSRARNAGAGAATHSRLVFLDADILVDDTVLKYISESSYSLGTCYVKADSPYFFDRLAMRIKSQCHRFGYCTGLIFIDKNLFEKLGRFNEKLSAGEDGKLLRAGKRQGGFGVVHGYVYNNMRRFRQKGYLRICLYWIKQGLLPSKKEYESVR
ncbi:glycosyltransferase [Candidatus Woesearchaeota archaeon]|nr:glycosyltransferase [Candidatus Woesearchaeota archaeon]